MGRLRLRQGPSQLRFVGRSSWRSSLFGLVLGLALLCAAPNAWAGAGVTPSGVLVYNARAGEQNQVSVSTSGSDYVVSDVVPIDADASGGCSISGNNATCPSSVGLIRIDTKDGDDVIAIDPGIPDPVSLFGGAGVDTVAYSAGQGGGVDVNLAAGTASRGGQSDRFPNRDFENVTGSGSDDTINVRGGGVNHVGCGGGADLVRSDPGDVVDADCEQVDDGVAPETTITSGPTNPTNATTVAFEFSSSKPGSTFDCLLNSDPLGSCTSPHTIADKPEGDYTFSVAAIDSFNNADPTPATWLFTIDRSPPDTQIDDGPPDNGTTNDFTPTFAFSSSDAQATFECQIDSGVHTSCGSPFTTPELSNGTHTFSVFAKDVAGNVDQTPATRTFTVDAPAAPPASGPPPAPVPQVTTSNVVIFGSLVLISGRTVKLVKGKLVPIRLTCSGPRKCEGRLTITSDKPVKKAKKKGKRIERLGSKLFSIKGNHSARVMVPLSRSKVRLIKRLHRLKTRATIRELDPRGRPRISTRTFLLRAR
jgi:Big-like domain-containing protein